jgi:hypothetical protein
MDKLLAVSMELEFHKNLGLMPTHLLLSESMYTYFLNLGGIKNPVSIVDFFNLKTILTKVPINNPRILFIN